MQQIKIDTFIEGKNRQSSSHIIRSKNNNKNRREMGLLSLLNLEFTSKRLVLKLKNDFKDEIVSEIQFITT